MFAETCPTATDCAEGLGTGHRSGVGAAVSETQLAQLLCFGASTVDTVSDEAMAV